MSFYSPGSALEEVVRCSEVKYILKRPHKVVHGRTLMSASNERMHRYVFNDSKSPRLRPDRNDCELNVQEEMQKVHAPKTR